MKERRRQLWTTFCVHDVADVSQVSLEDVRVSGLCCDEHLVRVTNGRWCFHLSGEQRRQSSSYLWRQMGAARTVTEGGVREAGWRQEVQKRGTVEAVLDVTAIFIWVRDRGR